MPEQMSQIDLTQNPPDLQSDQDTSQDIPIQPDFKENNFSIPIAITDAIEEKVKRIFQEELQTIEKERSGMYNGKGLEQQCEDNKSLYDGIVEPPDVGWKSSNFHIWLPTLMVDVATITSKEMTLTNPIMKFEIDDQFTAGEKKNDLADRESQHDFKLKTKIKIEDLLDPFYKNTYIYGTTFVEIPMCNDVEWAKYKRTYYLSDSELAQYEKNKEDIGDIIQFKKDYPDFADNKNENANLEKLISEGKCTAIVLKRIKKYYGALPRRIPIEKFWARPSIKDLSRQRMYADERDFVWSDIQKYADSGYYFKSQVDKLKTTTADYYKVDYTVFKVRLFCDLFDDGKLMRFMASIDKNTQTILRLEYYPYQHWQPDVVPFYIMPKDDCLYGYGFMERVKDGSKMMDDSWNILFDSFIWSRNPIVETDDDNFDFTAREWQPHSVAHHKKGTSIGVLKMDNLQIDSVNITTLAERFNEFATGVSALMSGQETPSDPRAPGNKTGMLLGESYKRIKDYTRELLKSLQKVSELIEQVDLQFNPDEYKYLTEGYIKEINRQIYNKKVRHIAQGLTLSINKEQDMAKIVGFIQLLIAYYPEKMQDPEIRYEILKAVMENTGGTIERLRKIICLSPEEEIKNRLKMILKELTEATASGDKAKIQQFMGMATGMGQPAPSAPAVTEAPPNAPPAAPAPGGNSV